MKTFILVFGLVVSLAVVGFGQNIVTNSTLEKYKQARLAAERDYRENYAQMGFPSPEELDRQREADMKALFQVSDQLRTARLEREGQDSESGGGQLNTPNVQYDGTGDGYFDGYGGFYSNGGHPRYRRQAAGGYRVTPVGVYPNPDPSITPFFSRGGSRGGGRGRTGRR